MPDNSEDKPQAKRKGDDRQSRLAQALRTNLRKRKAQARARRAMWERSSDEGSEQD